MVDTRSFGGWSAAEACPNGDKPGHEAAIVDPMEVLARILEAVGGGSAGAVGRLWVGQWDGLKQVDSRSA